ncbi:MAG: oxygenase MpaB family protein [Cyanobacteria bacterium P01_G01_bin.54]
MSPTPLAPDPCAIVHQLFGYEFPWDVTRALEFALLKTFCVPSISRLLAQTGEFTHRTQKRYDDTALLIAEIAQWGYDHERGQAAIARMNAIHGRFQISNEDFLYVLSTFIYEPIRWINQFGWRSLTEIEQDIYYQFWCVVGDRMQITNIPNSYSAFEQFHDRYEAEQFQYAATNQQIAQATQTLFLSWFPAPLRPVLAPCADALLEPLMVPALGAAQPSPWLTQTVRQSLRTRSYLAHLFPPRQRSHFYTELPNRTYPQGYRIQDLGPQREGGAIARDPS